MSANPIPEAVDAACRAFFTDWGDTPDEGKETLRILMTAALAAAQQQGQAVAWRDAGYGVIEDAAGREIGLTPGWSDADRRRMLDAVNAAPPSAPVGVEWPLSLLRAGHWREVYIGHRCMQLEVTYDYATWERLMAEVESALAQQPAAVGEEIMVNAAHDVFTLQLQPSGLSSGPRFVMHVPGPDQQPAAVDEAIRAAVEAEREACAKACDDRAAYYHAGDDDGPNTRRGMACEACASVIRWRGTVSPSFLAKHETEIAERLPTQHQEPMP